MYNGCPHFVSVRSPPQHKNTYGLICFRYYVPVSSVVATSSHAVGYIRPFYYYHRLAVQLPGWFQTSTILPLLFHLAVYPESWSFGNHFCNLWASEAWTKLLKKCRMKKCTSASRDYIYLQRTEKLKMVKIFLRMLKWNKNNLHSTWFSILEED